MKPVAKIKSTLDIQLDLTRPVEDLTEVISAVIATQPAHRKEILKGLDIAIRDALAEIQAQEEKEQKVDDDSSGKVSQTERRGKQGG
ncbi:hypothetical protein [Paenibacillus polymyxa]|uniref:hypothetical protein n=1 Tax=Paenibacillus polymyxa TaxID=1406 RepID=UPI0004DF82C6|nr:hypothetical protein [Paenibacillus polymyxa]RPE03302.1 hypothetical protein EG487_14795 [Paenibacillus polymyxa]